MKIRTTCFPCILLVFFAFVRPPDPSAAAPGPDPAPVNLYFIDPSNTYLKAEARRVPPGKSLTETARNIVLALLDGPQEGLLRSLPEGLLLRSLFVTEDKTAFVDFEKRADARIETGVLSEWLGVCSVEKVDHRACSCWL